MRSLYNRLSLGSGTATYSRRRGSDVYSSPGSFQELDHAMIADRSIEINDTADSLRQLQPILQLLALPVRAQVRLVEGDCTRIRQLSSAFHAAHLRVRKERTISLAVDQMRALDRLYTHLEQMSQNDNPTLCSELAMRRSNAWRRTRLMARDALVSFGWELALPPQNIISRELKLTTPARI